MKKLSKIVFILLVATVIISLMACFVLFSEIRQLDWGLAASTPEVTETIIEHLANAKPGVKTEKIEIEIKT